MGVVLLLYGLIRNIESSGLLWKMFFFSKYNIKTS